MRRSDHFAQKRLRPYGPLRSRSHDIMLWLKKCWQRSGRMKGLLKRLSGIAFWLLIWELTARLVNLSFALPTV